jgi:hypothetical protein
VFLSVLPLELLSARPTVPDQGCATGLGSSTRGSSTKPGGPSGATPAAAPAVAKSAAGFIGSARASNGRTIVMADTSRNSLPSLA